MSADGNTKLFIEKFAQLSEESREYVVNVVEALSKAQKAGAEEKPKDDSSSKPQ